MKKHILTLSLAIGALLCAIPLTASARDYDENSGHWDAHHHYRTDDGGYWDAHHKHQEYVSYHHHRGYWDSYGEHRIFITIP